MEGERWGLQVQAGVEFEKRVFQVAMEYAELAMESGGWSGQFGCRTEEGRSEMEEPEWVEESDALDESEPMEDKSCCVLGTEVEGPDQA